MSDPPILGPDPARDVADPAVRSGQSRRRAPLGLRTKPMRGRDPAELRRAATPLELLFDLAAVVAVAFCAEGLAEGLAEGRTVEALIRYPLVFFAIWWAWMEFTWFASAFDTDDAVYRVAIFVQMGGSLVLAAGAPEAFNDGDFATVTIGYVLMRVGLISLWLRVRHDTTTMKGKATATRYAVSLTVLQVGWLALISTSNHTLFYVGFAALVVGELAVPFIAQRPQATPWNPEHIAERYGLFTIIVLGESVVASTAGLRTAVDAGEGFADLAGVAAGGLVLVFAMWWLYFDQPAVHVAKAIRGSRRPGLRAARWGYGHYLIFGSAAATGAGLALNIDRVGHHSAMTDQHAALAVAVPAAVYAVTVWVLHEPRRSAGFKELRLLIVTALLATSFLPEPVVFTALVMVGAVILETYAGNRSQIANDAVTASHATARSESDS